MSKEIDSVDNSSAQVIEAQIKEADKIDRNETLSRMLDESGYVRTASKDASAEMTKPPRIDCTPPITPCRVTENPPNPVVVDRAVAKVWKYDSALIHDVDTLEKSKDSAGDQFKKDIPELFTEVNELDKRASELSKATRDSDNYDKDAIVTKAEKVAEITEKIDATINKLKQDASDYTEK